jgi:hypothetical protein
MLNPWLTLSIKAFQLGLESQSVVALRMMRLASVCIGVQLRPRPSPTLNIWCGVRINHFEDLIGIQSLYYQFPAKSLSVNRLQQFERGSQFEADSQRVGVGIADRYRCRVGVGEGRKGKTRCQNRRQN